MLHAALWPYYVEREGLHQELGQQGVQGLHHQVRAQEVRPNPHPDLQNPPLSLRGADYMQGAGQQVEQGQHGVQGRQHRAQA